MLLFVMVHIVKWSLVCPPGFSSRHRNSCISKQHIAYTQAHIFCPHASKAGQEHEPHCQQDQAAESAQYQPEDGWVLLTQGEGPTLLPT